VGFNPCACNAKHWPRTLALKNIENRVAWFAAELCKAKKGVQKDKRETSARQSSLGGV